MKKILICHDGHEITTTGTIDYVKGLKEPCNITLFHVLEPVPPDLQEYGGTEEEAEETRRARIAWISENSSRARGNLEKCRNAIEEATANRVRIKIVPSYMVNDFLPLLEEELKADHYDEVVIIHHADSWIRNLLEETWAGKAKRTLSGVRLTIVRCSEESGICFV